MTRARDLAAGTFELATGGVLKLETSDTTVTDGSVLGKIEFKAPDEASGTDANLTAAAIEAVAEGTFAADNNATELVFKTGASAAADAKMTLTSAGNLLVGTTDAAVGSSSSVTGGVISAAGIISNGVDGNVCAVLNRQSSDGEILRLRKAGTTVGSIGALTSGSNVYLTIGNADTGIIFNAVNDAVHPWNITSNAGRDAAIDLGRSSQRFKDLYLSGGIFLGGTGAANKLEDYEEGTWEPVVLGTSDNPTVTYQSDNGGYYIKIGRMVYLTGCVRWTALSGGSGNFNIGNLPFSNSARTNGDNGDSIGATRTVVWGGTSTRVPTAVGMRSSTTNLNVFATRYDNTAHTVAIGDLGSTGMVQFTVVTYTG